MGILENRRRRKAAQVAAAGPATGVPGYVDPSTFPIASPWSSSNLQRIVFDDIFGSELPANTREAAMRLATVARARNLVCATVSRLPLQVVTGQTPDPTPAPWITSAAGGVSPQLRMAWTVDDLIFYGWSVWWRENDPATGLPLEVQRVNMGDWNITDDGVVEVNGVPAAADQVIVIPGLHEGILSFGVDVIDDARTLYRNVRQRIANPIPAVDLHQTTGNPLSTTERDDLIDAWTAARTGANGGVAYTSPQIEAREMGQAADAQLMIEARNAAAVDLARLVGVHAGLVDATAPKASLNYETQTGRNQEFVDFDLALYLTPIAARLSLDDVTPAGTRIDFDLTDYTAPAPNPAGPGFED